MEKSNDFPFDARYFSLETTSFPLNWSGLHRYIEGNGVCTVSMVILKTFSFTTRTSALKHWTKLLSVSWFNEMKIVLSTSIIWNHWAMILHPLQTWFITYLYPLYMLLCNSIRWASRRVYPLSIAGEARTYKCGALQNRKSPNEILTIPPA